MSKNHDMRHKDPTLVEVAELLTGHDESLTETLLTAAVWFGLSEQCERLNDELYPVERAMILSRLSAVTAAHVHRAQLDWLTIRKRARERKKLLEERERENSRDEVPF